MDKLENKQLSRVPELSVIIVDFKSEKFTLPLVQDLPKKLAGINYEIIIVDNDPTGKADQVFKQELSGDLNVKIVKAKENKGYGSGNNLGAADAKGKFLWLLNPDTEIFDGTAEKMMDFLSKHTEVGALTPIVLQPDKKTPQHHFFGHFQSLGRIIFRNQAGKLPKKPLDFFYADMVTGAALMISRELYQKLGGFDEQIFMYLEDEDLCRRIVKLGLKNAVLTSAKIVHFEGQSSTSFEKKKFYYHSQDYYWQKHFGGLEATLMKVIRLPYILLQKLKS